MTDDEGLREASDPTTPGERLDRLLADATEAFRVAPAGPSPARDRARRQLAALASNPGLPPATLANLLRGSHRSPATVAAWHNPVVPLVLVSHPSYEKVAASLLVHLEIEANRDGITSGVEVLPLEHEVARWAREDVGDSEPHDEVRAFARHLASLFGLPWLEP